MTNLPTFKALIEKYDNATKEQIESAQVTPGSHFGHAVAKDLFGFDGNCSLCAAVDDHCEKCVWTDSGNLESCNCISPPNNKTWHAISQAKDIEQLLTAFKNRAAHMRQHLSNLNL